MRYVGKRLLTDDSSRALREVQYLPGCENAESEHGLLKRASSELCMRFPYYSRMCFDLPGRHQGPKVPVWGAVNLLGPKLLRNVYQACYSVKPSTR